MEQSPATPEQLSLGLAPRTDASFANFWVSPENEIPVAALHQFCRAIGDSNVLIWGFSGCGLTHLLEACSRRAQSPLAYLPLRDALDLDPSLVIANLESVKLVCIDDVELIAGRSDWELAIFHLYNRLRDLGHMLLLASHEKPTAIDFSLPDLRSRVLGSVIYKIDHLSDTQKAQALILRARERGMVMSVDVAEQIVKKAPRRMKALFEWLDKLDSASLKYQKKLTPRFVKQVLDGEL